MIVVFDIVFDNFCKLHIIVIEVGIAVAIVEVRTARMCTNFSIKTDLIPSYFFASIDSKKNYRKTIKFYEKIIDKR